MATAPAPQLLSLADPVTFSGEEAAAFLGSLPRELPEDARARLRASACAATEAMSSQPANAYFA
ncbi:MAG TPA: hypothetical protein VF587_03535 [Solirubrobacteraceae bacterium]|jgi:hypothetical protein